VKYRLTFIVWEKIPSTFTYNGIKWNTNHINEHIIPIDLDTVDHRENYSDFERALATKENEVGETLIRENPNYILVSIKYFESVEDQS
jgi:hypothetical protein